MHKLILFFILLNGTAHTALAQEGERVPIDRSTIHDVIVEAYRLGGIDIQVYIPDQQIMRQQYDADMNYANTQADNQERYQRSMESAEYWRKRSRETQGWFALENLEPYKKRWAQEAKDTEWRALTHVLDSDAFADRQYDRQRPMVSAEEVGDIRTIKIPAKAASAERILRGLMGKGGSFIRGGVLAGVLAATAGATLVPEESMPQSAFDRGEIQAVETQIDVESSMD